MGLVQRRRDHNAPSVVYRTARCGLRVTQGQRNRLFGLLRSAGDVRSCVLDLNRWRRQRGNAPVTGYQELCRELSAGGSGTFGELDTVGARSVLRSYSDSWFSAAKRRAAGDKRARFPRRKRGLVPVRWYHGTFRLEGRALRVPVAKGCPPLHVRLDRDVPYPAGQVRSVMLGYAEGRLYVDVTAEVPVAAYPTGEEPDPARVAGVDLGVIHPYAVAGPDGDGLLVSGRAVRAEHRQHLRDRKGRQRAAARRAPKPGQQVSRRWREHRRRERKAEARHTRRVRQAQHEAAKEVITWAVTHQIGTIKVGDPRGILDLKVGRRHNKRTRDWQVGRLIAVLVDKARVAGITVNLVDERGTSSTCPECSRRVPKPAGRVFSCPHCGQGGHRDLIGAASIAARGPGGGTIPAIPHGAGITHRRAGRHLPGVHPARRDPRRRPSSRPAHRRHLAGTGPPRTPSPSGLRGVARPTSEEHGSMPGTTRLACEQVHLEPLAATSCVTLVALKKFRKFMGVSRTSRLVWVSATLYCDCVRRRCATRCPRPFVDLLVTQCPRLRRLSGGAAALVLSLGSLCPVSFAHLPGYVLGFAARDVPRLSASPPAAGDLWSECGLNP
jgi:IS605 OrfB family transposase